MVVSFLLEKTQVCLKLRISVFRYRKPRLPHNDYRLKEGRSFISCYVQVKIMRIPRGNGEFQRAMFKIGNFSIPL